MHVCYKRSLPAGPCWEVVGVVGVEPAVVVAARRDKIDLSDICNRCATGGIRARVAGRRLTSDFMSDKSSSSWFRTYIQKKYINHSLQIQ
jgi:hypothetical protein